MKHKIQALLLVFFPLCAFANSDMSHLDPAAPIIFWGTLIFVFGVMGRQIAKMVHLPGVLGELLMGVLVGNVCYACGLQLAVILREGPAIFNIMTHVFAGMPIATAVHDTISNPQTAAQVTDILSQSNGSNLFKIAYVVDIFSRYGVIFLLFMVGLESSVEDLKHTGRASIQVALIGVIAPILLGLLATHFLMPSASFQADLFVAATLSATSIGITARVLKDLKKLRTREAKTILGAAMIDDILGLIILAIVSSIAISGTLDLILVARVIILAGLFFFGALWVGPWVLRQTVKTLSSFELWEAKLFTAVIFLMTLAWLATLVQLAAIIGAFVAGILLHDGFFNNREKSTHSSQSIKTLIAPLEAILAPLFFMLIGIQVKLESFLHGQVLLIAGGLIIAAIVGKLLSGIGANRKDDRLLIGIGMLPRGEVGLVFASIGKTIGIISDDLFSAIILMVIITTLLAPPWLKFQYSKHKGQAHDAT